MPPIKTRKIRRTYRRRARPETPFLIFGAIGVFLLLTIIIIFTIYIINDSQKKNDIIVPGFTDVSSTQSAESGSSKVDEEQSSSEISSAAPKPVAFQGTVVPPTQPVDDNYFSDAIFVGDSISLGLKAYGVVPISNVVAEKNVNIYNIIKEKKVYYNTKNVAQTLYECIDEKNKNPGKIYVLLGSNGIPGYSNEQQIEQYKTLIQTLKSKYKNSMIYIESVTPITSTAKGFTEEFTNSKIDDFNKKLEVMVKEEGVYFLKVNEVLKGSDGFLDKKYNAGDGIHLTKTAHQAMYQYYKTHAVQSDKTIYPASK